MRRKVRGRSAAWHSVDRVRAVVYGAVVVLVVIATGARLGWFNASTSAAAETVVALQGETGQQQPIAVTLNRGTEAMQGLQTSLIGVCGNGTTYRISWTPNSPRVRFLKLGGYEYASEELKQGYQGGVASDTGVWMKARLQGDRVTGEIRFEATFRYPDHRVVQCASGHVGWSAARAGTTGGEPPALPVGTWAGYIWRGPVKSVQASWKVPVVEPGSVPGYAGTWIGAQGDPQYSPHGFLIVSHRGSARPGREAFIQVGTNEQRTSLPDGRLRNSYYAFWTDTVHHFGAIALFAVRPGDDVSARLVLARGRWTVSVIDRTSRRHATLTTTDDGSAIYNLAEWLQEHPLVRATENDEQYSYPLLSATGMRHIGVNSTVPRYTNLYASWMNADGGYLAPGPLVDGSFEFHRAAISDAGRQYLQIIGDSNEAEQNFIVEQTAWTSATPRAVTVAETARLTNVLQASVARLQDSRWPSRVQTLVHRMTAQLLMLRARIAAPARLTLSAVSTWRQSWATEMRAMTITGHAIRRALGLPELT